ncbi:MAG: hypothetical protein JW836_10735 [Deltaproteobacteria bacterium]|nr:hypothetical protein [Deltaproteobacteria bacterium]
MIKREHIKRAVDAISRRNPDIGYSLDEMLAMGLIDVPSAEEERDGNNFFFLFDGEKVLVNRVLFFNEGIVPVEQGLLIKYGELVKKQELQAGGNLSSYRNAPREIRRAGLRTAVFHEIDYAVKRLRNNIETSASLDRKRDEGLIGFLEELKRNIAPLNVGANDPAVFYRGVVDEDMPAYFMPFPISAESLMQVADMNVEFFHVRFVLNCLIRGVEGNLLACVSEGTILGLVFLAVREQVFKKDLEIKYLATLRGKTWDVERPSFKPPKGVGTFLIAGVWLLWKNEMPKLKELVLDSELGARQFYDSLGFSARGLARYVLKEPKANLLKSILNMTHHCPELSNEAIHEIRKLIARQIKRLRKKFKGDSDASERRAVVTFILECLKPDARQEFVETACSNLIKYRTKIPESREILRFSVERASG